MKTDAASQINPRRGFKARAILQEADGPLMIGFTIVAAWMTMIAPVKRAVTITMGIDLKPIL